LYTLVIIVNRHNNMERRGSSVLSITKKQEQ